ncbi:MAG TPA: TlpA disulfide reductase family protein [Geobacterales bacterium]|nr:TlpA disulfide reductase family protein [Geobacterales bacterium]
MKRSQRNVIIASVVLIFIAGILLLTLQGQQSSGGQAIDLQLPVINANGLTGSTARLSDFKGNVIFLEFAVEWCPHCRNMVGTISQLYNNFHNKGVVFITIMLSANTDINKTAQFIKQYGITWLSLYDINGEAQTKYNIQYTPTFIIIDKNFNISYKTEGETSYDTLANQLSKLL